MCIFIVNSMYSFSALEVLINTINSFHSILIPVYYTIIHIIHLYIYTLYTSYYFFFFISNIKYVNIHKLIGILNVYIYFICDIVYPNKNNPTHKLNNAKYHSIACGC